MQALPTPRPPHPLEAAVADTLAAAFAVAAVAAAIGRYAVETGVEGSRAVVHRLPAARTPRGGLLGAVVRVTDRPRAAAGHVLDALADRVVPRVAREVLARVDVTALVAEYVDLDAIVALVDLDRAVDRVDIARVIDKVDLDAVVARVDLDAAVDRVDIARVIAKVDLDAVVDTVDLDRAVDRVDIDRVIDKVDIIGLARYVIQEIDLPALVRYSTGSVTTEMVRGVRGQSVDADRAVERIVDRLLMRRAGRRAGQSAEAGQSPDGEHR